MSFSASATRGSAQHSKPHSIHFLNAMMHAPYPRIFASRKRRKFAAPFVANFCLHYKKSGVICQYMGENRRASSKCAGARFRPC